MNSKSPIKLGRRDLLKVMTAGAGVLTVSAFLPKKWLKPVVDFGVSPVHAQASMEVGTITGHVYTVPHAASVTFVHLTPLKDAVVSVDDMPSCVCITDANGLYNMTNVPVGNRRISCVPPQSYYVALLPDPATNVLVTVNVIIPAVQDFTFKENIH